MCGRKRELLEVSVFLFLIIPSMAFSLVIMREHLLDFKTMALSIIMRDLSLVSLILFLLWRNGEPPDKIGWTSREALIELLLGLLLFFPVFYGTGLFGAFLKKIGFSAPKQPLPSFLTPNTTLEYLFASFLVVVIAISEETIFRGYLILRFKALSKHPLVPILLSTGIFSLGHGYQGTAGLIVVVLIGLILAFIYVWRKNLIAPIVIHFMYNFTALVIVPLFSKS